MYSTKTVTTVPNPFVDSPTTALSTVVIGTALFLTIVGVVSKSLYWLFGSHVTVTARSRTMLSLSGSALGELIVFVLLVLFLRYRGRSLRDLGFNKASPLRGWIVAAVFTSLYVWVALSTVLKGNAPLAEVSAFHIYGSLAAGLSAGLVEEVFFRGFVMNQLRWAGFGTATQVVASGFLFGVAHAGWGLVSKHPDWSAAVGAMVATGVLGIFFALTYIASRRSLIPAIFGHVIMDMLIEPWLILVTVASTIAHSHS